MRGHAQIETQLRTLCDGEAASQSSDGGQSVCVSVNVSVDPS